MIKMLKNPSKTLNAKKGKNPATSASRELLDMASTLGAPPPLHLVLVLYLEALPCSQRLVDPEKGLSQLGESL